ncbi:retrotransposon protein, putative, ty1-copia subclass [Tanacetum coccineum]
MTPLPYPVASQAAHDAYEELNDAQNEVACLMLGRMTLAELNAMLKTPCERYYQRRLKTLAVLAIVRVRSEEKKNSKGQSVKAREMNKVVHAPKDQDIIAAKRDILQRTLSVTTCSGGWLLEEEFSGLKGSTRLKHGALSLYMGNGMRAAVEAIRSFDLILLIARKPFPHQVERAKDLLGLIHTDVCGPFRTVLREGASYFITFTDNFSRYGFVYLMKHKHEVFENFKVFQNEVENQLGKKIKAIRSDRGGKYLRYALETTAHNLNMVPTKKVDRTPYKIWHGKAPKLSYLRVWGCYPKETMCYYFYYPLENKNFVSQNSEFFKNSFMVQEASGSHRLLKMSRSDKGLEIFQEEDTQPSKNTSKQHNEVAPIKVEPQNVRVPMRDLDEPPNYKAALADPEFYKWIEAMNTKMQSMKDNQAWILTRLEAKGYTQTYKVDYGEAFSPVADIRAIRILLAIATFYDYEIWKMYVKTTFLNGYLSDGVYMVQLEGFVDPKHPNKVCKLQRSIFRLKQASRNLGEAAYILGIKIIRDRSKRLIALSQSAYLEKILRKFRTENSKKGYTPMMEKSDYKKLQGAKTPTEVQHMQIVPYASAIGSIMYAVRRTRPDVAFAQNLCSRFQQNPDMALVFGAKPKDELKVSCYADANFQTDRDDTKSQTGNVFALNGGAIDWKSAKQITTVMSSIEAEYIVAGEASMEAVWMRKFIDGLGGVMPSNKRPMEMLCDNEPALAIAKGEIILKKVHTDDNVADPFTKPMPFNKHFEHAIAIGIVPASSLL